MNILFDQGVPKKLRQHLPGDDYLPLVPQLLTILDGIEQGKVEYLYADEKLRRKDELKGRSKL